MKKIYIAGKITGLSVHTYVSKFENAAKKLIAAGYEPVNPVTLVNNPTCTQLEAMQIVLPEMMLCDAIYMMPCIVDSRGGKIEKELADYTSIPTVERIEDLKLIQWRVKSN